jgi:phosphocarrier protein FPr
MVISAAGGLADKSLGTSFEKIERALNEAYSDDGVLILMDLGSAVMTTQMVVETFPPEKQLHIRLCNAPLVEGAIAAAAQAAAGKSLEDVQSAAERVLSESPKIAASERKDTRMPSEPAVESEASGTCLWVDVIVPNPAGLHARPAMQLVKTASRFRARITLQNLTRKQAPVDAKMAMQVAFGGTARRGDTIRIQAAGDDAQQALADLRDMIETGFAETQTAAAPSPPTAIRSLINIGAAEGTLPERIRGVGVSEGYSVAPAFVYLPQDAALRSPTFYEGLAPKTEVHRLRKAIQEAESQLQKLQLQVEQEVDENTGWILGFQKMLLEDVQIHREMEDTIQNDRQSAAGAVRRVFAAWREKAGKLDETMRARAGDLRDVENRLLKLLLGTEANGWSGLTNPSIVVAADLSPSDLARLDRSLVSGIATAAGCAASHTAILARSRGIPAVVGLGKEILAIPGRTRLALDGTTGLLEINPSDESLKAVQKHAAAFAEFRAAVPAEAHQPALTQDGKRVSVLANTGDPDSAREALHFGAEGIGLLRTEFLYLYRSTLPNEAEQYAAYRSIVETMGQRPVVMRTLDAGGDKQLPYMDVGHEANPSLGVRAIRLSLKRPDIFQPQLRAMLRAAAKGNVKIMFPMISTMEELFEAKAALSNAADSLARDGLAHANTVEVGIMVETPAAALKTDILAREVDFLSIGSNDLTQYTLACDRGNRKVQNLFDTCDPAVLRLIKRIIEGAHGAGKRVGLCGEFAGDRKAISFLLGLGLDEFSVAAARLPAVKQWIRQLDTVVCRAETEKMFRC